MGFSTSVGTLLRLAGPLAIGEVATMLGGVATTMMLGQLGADAIGAYGLGGILYFNVALFGFDALMALDYPVSHAVGAGRLDEARAHLVQGCWLAALLTLALTAVMTVAYPLLRYAGLDEPLVRDTLTFLRITRLGLLPVMLWIACRRYLQARGLGRLVMLTLLSALGVELLAKWMLIFGRFGAPALGLHGAAWGAVIEFVYLGVVGLTLVCWVTRADGLPPVSLPPDRRRLVALARLGMPSGLRSTVEIGFIAAVTTFAAQVDTVSLAAHQITLNLASLTFMVPLGLAAGTAVQVGNALGAGQPALAGRAGWTGIASGAAFMSLCALVFVGIPGWLLGAYTSDAAVIATGIPLLACAAAFQLFDGVQVIATGALRGSGDTRTPLLANLVAHWGIGLPLGWWLCFRAGLGVVGLWAGLSTGLVLVGSILVGVWARRTRSLSEAGLSHR
jgi:multidrug resistance protein, MATE family